MHIKQFNENVLSIRIVLFLGKQELALRSHHEDVASVNHGKFNALLEAIIQINPLDMIWKSTIHKSQPSHPH